MNNHPTITLTSELISRASVTPEDKGCQGLMITRLQALGFEITPLRFGEVDNFFALKKGSVGDTTFMFAGHTDVVPVGDESAWSTPPFTPTIKEGKLYGRGAADMKGSLAAMIVATEEFITTYPDHKQNIAYLITSDEEGPATDGTIKVCEYLKEHNIPIDYCLVGEPSSTNVVGDVIKNGRRGSLNGFIEIIGKQGHIAYPHLAKNPIHLATPFLAELLSIVWDEGDEYFDPTSLQISNINAGTGATNVIPNTLKLVLNFRYNTLHQHQELSKRVEALLAKHELNYQAIWQHSGASFVTPEAELVNAAVVACKEIAGVNSNISTSGGTSDGRFIAPILGAQVIELGPLNATIHQVNECVGVKDLVQLTQMYQRILQQLCE